MERNFETVMIEQCAPVLAGLKPAGLFRYETRDCADLAARVRRHIKFKVRQVLKYKHHEPEYEPPCLSQRSYLL